MALTHDIGRFFWYTIRLHKEAPVIHRAPTHETDPPFRWSNSLVLHIKPTGWGVVLGWWHDSGPITEVQAILRALQGKNIDPWWEDNHQAQEALRKKIAEFSDDVDTEIQVLDAMGLL